MAKEKKFLFVCGCPRSGTTVLAQLLNWHPKISLGIERFGKLLNKNQQRFTPKLFGLNRFFNIRKVDCFYDSFDFHAYSQWYCSKFERDKYRRSFYVGDKNPKFYQHFEVLNTNFTEVDYKVIFIIRDIYSVAQSYDLRANNPNDKWKAAKNFKQAVVDWNEAISIIADRLQSPEAENFIPLDYDSLFTDYQRGKDKLPELFGCLGLKVTEEVLQGYQLLEENSHKIIASNQKKQQFQATEIDREYVSNNALLDKYQQIKIRSL